MFSISIACCFYLEGLGGTSVCVIHQSSLFFLMCLTGQYAVFILNRLKTICILEVKCSIEELIIGKVLLTSWIQKIIPPLAKQKYKFCKNYTLLRSVF